MAGRPYLELNNQGEILHFELTRDHHMIGRDRAYVDLTVPIEWRVVSSIQATIRRVGQEYVIYDGDSYEPSTNGLFLNHTRITVTPGYSLYSGIEIKIGQNPQNLVRLRYFNPENPGSPPIFLNQSISLKNQVILLGRDPEATLRLDSPIVSRRHAIIRPDGRGRYLLKNLSPQGVFVDRQPVQRIRVLPNPATLRIGQFTLLRRDHTLELCDSGNQVRLDIQQLRLSVKNRQGKSKVLLNDLSFAIEPGQFVALVGGSGAGKSTLMRTLLGTQPITKGRVYINGENLYKSFDLYRNQIGYVPQDDIVHSNLTVGEVLTYAAQLRLPADVNVPDIVQKTLFEIDLLDRREALVHKLSGGQRKRVSIGVELLSDPKLFFLDEPTSGLDLGLDKKMMQLLRKLANQGRTIVLVTHAAANIKLCDRMLFLGRGGRLCYFGPPIQAFEFFQLQGEDFADIYNLLDGEEAVAQNWAKKFRRSPQYQRYVANHLSIGEQLQTTIAPPPPTKRASRWGQFLILSRRYSQLMLRDPVSLSLNLFTAPVGILLIRLAIRDQNPFADQPSLPIASLARQVLFVFTCAALWVGLSSSLQEIVRETVIYQRERLVNLDILSYLGSKLSVLSALAVVQTLLMTLVILISFAWPESNLISWPIGIGVTTWLTLLGCISLGLMVSAMVKNNAQASSALPIILLPQIIFSGILFKMEGLSRVFSWLMLSRWSIGAYGTLADVNQLIPRPVQLPNGTTIAQSIQASAAYEPTWENLVLNWGMLLLHSLCHLGITWGLQKRKDIF